MIRRLQSDQQFSSAGEKFQMKYVWQCLYDKKTWLGGVYIVTSLFTCLSSAFNLSNQLEYTWACQ